MFILNLLSITLHELIQLISGPRNISTALMYSFGNREDTAIVDEPYYAYYLKTFHIDHPGKEETMASQSSDSNIVTSQLLDGNYDKKYLFVKNMAHHMDGYDYSYSTKIRNLFLIRNPKQLIASFAKVIERPTSRDVGLQREVELYKELSHSSAYKPIVLDSGELLKNPEKVLKEMCSAIDIPFDEKMLSWEAGARIEDGAWAPYWYSNVHKSTAFQKQKSSDTKLKEDLIPLYQEVLPYYDFLFSKAIKA